MAGQKFPCYCTYQFLTSTALKNVESVVGQWKDNSVCLLANCKTFMLRHYMIFKLFPILRGLTGDFENIFHSSCSAFLWGYFCPGTARAHR